MALTSADISNLYRAHAQSVLRFAMRRTLDAQLSVDLVGETFAIAFEDRAKFRGEIDHQGASWLFGIANNLLNNYFRSGEIERRALQRFGVSETLVSEDQLERIEELSESAALRDAVAAALTDLTDDHREALRLRVVEERSYSEIAAELEVSEQVARARVSRALGSLRERLDDLDSNEVIENV